MAATIASNVSLRLHNTFGVDVRAAYFATVANVDALRDVLADPRVRGRPRLIIGGGSNILFTRDFDGLVIKIDIRGVSRLPDDDTHWRVRIGAGEPWHGTVTRLLDEGLPGLENLALIAGSIGAAPIQNIGAYGLELAERLESVDVFEPGHGVTRTLSVTECGFGYRDSAFKRDLPGARIVTHITLALPKRWQAVTGYADVAAELRARGIGEPTPRHVFDAVVAIRTRKLPDPAVIGNAGSFFKNPIVDHETRELLLARHPSLVHYDIGGGRSKLAAGWLVDACGLKGAVRGRAGIYPKQALVLVNLGGATGAEVLAVAREVQQTVFERFGVALEPEPAIL